MDSGINDKTKHKRSEIHMEEIILWIIITCLAYLFFPGILILTKKKFSKKKAKVISVINSVIVFVLFSMLHLLSDGNTANEKAAVTWGFICYWILKSKCTYKTDEEILRGLFGEKFDELLSDWVGFYIIRKGFTEKQINSSIANQLKDELLAKLEYEKGKKYVKLINKFDKRIDWREFATEINLDQRIEVGEFNKKEGGKVYIDKHEDQNNLKTSDIN